MLQTTFLLPISKRECYPPTLRCMHDSRCCKQLFSCLLERGECYPPTLRCMHDSRCCKQLSSFPLARGSVTHPHSGACMTLDVANDFSKLHCVTPYVANHFFLPISKGESYRPKLQCMTPDVADDVSPAH